MDVTVVKTHCAEVALAMFAWLAVSASRPLGLSRLRRVERIAMPPVHVEVSLCEPAGSLESCSTIPSPPALKARVARQVVATPARQCAFSIARVTGSLGCGAHVGGVRRSRGGVSLTAVVGIMLDSLVLFIVVVGMMWTIRLDVSKHIGMQILRLGLRLFIGVRRGTAVNRANKHPVFGLC